MERRTFLKASCGICLTFGAGAVIGGLASCAPLPVYEADISGSIISVPRAIFEREDFQLVRAGGLDFDIGVRKQTDGTYLALLLRCTHASNRLATSGNLYTCTLHGSKYDLDGNVVQGPAQDPLRVFPTSLTETHIIISIE